AACRLFIPDTICHTRVFHGKLTRDIRLFWNPLIKEMEFYVCDGCQNDTQLLTICDRFHLICRDCKGSCATCGRKLCRACFPKGCPKCEAESQVS
ncbi:MAG: hypothetical protein HY731_13275, partial [Candidatus Tectomicrobia bacterium]|nr:hypothetical protein [Candidatus Tectomicrobia bacterium]